MHTARARTSGEYLAEVCFVMAPPSQGLEPPANPERFISKVPEVAVGAIWVDGRNADKPAICAKFQMSGSIPIAAFEARSKKCHELPFKPTADA
jgi:hypothetical protein